MMRKKILILLAISLTISQAFISCNLSTAYDEEAPGNHCAITNATLGLLTRKVNSKTSAGKDTIFTTTFSGSLYAMQIDQYKNEIYNLDSLPYGTNIKKIVFSSLASDGIVSRRLPSGNDTVFVYTDTLDFTSPQKLICHSYSGIQKKEYTVKVNMHQVNPEEFPWGKAEDANPLIKQFVKQKAIAANNKIYVFGNTPSTSHVLTTSENDDNLWESFTLSFSEFTPEGVHFFDGKFYYANKGNIYESTDGKDWVSVSANINPQIIVATSSQFMFAIADGAIYYSANATNWTKDLILSTKASLPEKNISSVCLPMSFNEDFEYILLTGVRDNQLVEWKKVIDKKGGNTEGWIIFNDNPNLSHSFPNINDSKMVKYDNRTFAAGIENDTLSLFYVSDDAGRTWTRRNASYIHPSNMSATNFSWAVDSKSFLWIICGGSGDIYRGRINRLGFSKNQTAFTD